MTTDAFERWDPPLDPDTPLGKKYGWKYRFPPGDGFATVAVDVVDPTSTTVVASPLITVSGLTWGALGGGWWGATVRIVGNGAPVGAYYLRLRFTTLQGDSDDDTMWVELKQN